ncbi:MAG: hypothetical protein BMS9Abin02_0468 [Anaerolineae bacterium]|nr:MAG: hypothetical protein BMS9Abin02_0468 [Anaerolineae bacterium]
MSENIIVIFSSDMMSSLRIESTVSAINYRSILISSSDELGQDQDNNESQQPAEPISGIKGILTDKITRWRPNLLIFDMGSSQIPWQDWLASINTSPATRNIPTLCYGPHVDVANFRKAIKLGADLAVPRSRFFKEMDKLILEYARIDSEGTFMQACRDSLSDSAVQGLIEFNEQNFFEAHEYLEDAWNNESGEGRGVYRGILQVAVAYLQIKRANYRGAVKMVLRSRQWLNPLPEVCRGIDIAQLKDDKELVYDKLISLGPEKVKEFDTSKLKPIKFFISDEKPMTRE